MCKIRPNRPNFDFEVFWLGSTVSVFAFEFAESASLLSFNDVWGVSDESLIATGNGWFGPWRNDGTLLSNTTGFVLISTNCTISVSGSWAGSFCTVDSVSGQRVRINWRNAVAQCVDTLLCCVTRLRCCSIAAAASWLSRAKKIQKKLSWNPKISCFLCNKRQTFSQCI